jgi:hypothetical protein
MSTSEGNTQQNVVERFAQAYRDYVQAVQDIWLPRDAQQQAIESYNRYLATLQSINQDIQRQATEAYNQYVRSLQDAWTRPDVQQASIDAYAEYSRATHDLVPQALQQQAADAYRTFSQGLQDAVTPEQVQERASAALRTYLDTIREVWGELDVNVVDANSLLALSQSLMSVGYIAASIQQSIQQSLVATGRAVMMV